MARPFKNTDNAIESLCRSMMDSGYYKKLSIRTIRHNCKSASNYLALINPDVTPMTMTSDDVKRLHQIFIDNQLEIATQRNYMFALKLLCEYTHNRCFDGVRLIYGQDTRPNVDWLTPTQAETILHTPKTPIEDMIVWLALCHGLRRIEIVRLRVGDIDINRGFIKVTGKGRGQGKIRYVHCHPRFYIIYNKWMEERKAQESKAQETTDALLTWSRGRKQSGYEAQSIPEHIYNISERVGFKFSLHTLRRTFGRELWRSGVKITTIANILGHKSIEMTIRYLGINLDDQEIAMQMFSLGKD